MMHVRIDKTGPVITVAAPLEGAQLARDQRIAASFSITDALSSVVSQSSTVPNGAFLDTAIVGPHSVTITARDVAGNVTTLNVNYTVEVAGNIDPGNSGAQYAWGENVGWINLRPSHGPGVSVTNTAVTGLAWGENIGWISFSCQTTGNCSTSNYGVANSSSGHLSGYAWGENVGWINFAPAQAGVTIDRYGRFHGAAWGENIGWINFDYSSSGTTGAVTSWHPPMIPPVLTLLGPNPMTVEIKSAFADPGATATDSNGVDLTPSISVAGTVNTNALGTYTLTYSVTDGNSVTTSADRIVHVVDTSPPVLTVGATAGGQPYSFGAWTNADVIVTFACTDNGSGVDTVTPPIVVSAEGAAQSVTGACTDVAGNQTQVTVPGISIDKTAPNAPSVIVSGTPNAAGWLREDVLVSFSDNGDAGAVQSGVAGCTSPQSITSDTAGTQVIGTCNDHAGNVSAPTGTTVKLDTMPPVVAITGVFNGAVYSFGAVPVAGCSTSDTPSGVAVEATVSIAGGTPNGVGSFTATCSGATDFAGNTAAPVNATYSVRYTSFIGFLPPLASGDGSYSGLYKLGRTIPVKWQLMSGAGQYIASLSSVQSLKTVFSNCSDAPDGDPTDLGITGGTSLRYDSAANQFIFNWDTRGLAQGCYTIELTLDDGATHTTTVRLKP